MAKKPASNQASAPVKHDIKKVNRKRRNALERKCLPKALKAQFSGSDRATFRMLLKAWQDSRRKGVSALVL